MSAQKLVTPKLTALRAKNQSTLNKWVKSDVAHHQANNELAASYDNDIGEGNLPLQSKLRRRAEKHFDNAMEYWCSLPKDERKAAEHFMVNFRGY